MYRYFLNKSYLYVWKRKRMSILLLWRKPNIFDYIRPFYPKVNKLAWNPLDSKQLLLVVWLNYYQTVFRVLLDHFWKSFYSTTLKKTKSNLHDSFLFSLKNWYVFDYISQILNVTIWCKTSLPSEILNWYPPKEMCLDCNVVTHYTVNTYSCYLW